MHMSLLPRHAPMRSVRLLFLAIVCLFTLNAALTRLSQNPPLLPLPAVDARALAPNFGNAQLSFIPNAGQSDSGVRFQAQGLGGMLFFKQNELLLSLPIRDAQRKADSLEPHVRSAEGESRPPTTIKLHFDGASPNAEVVGAKRLPGSANYFIGNDPTRWHANLPTYANIVYQDLYPGIDLTYDGRQGMLKGTYTVAIGADPTRIRWRYDRAEQTRIDPTNGNLIINLVAPTTAGLAKDAAGTI